jgi:hypothetical protein
MASGYKDTADGADFPINLLDQGDWRYLQLLEGSGLGGT